MFGLAADPVQSASIAWILGEQFCLSDSPDETKRLKDRVSSLFRFTYRRGFSPIVPSNITCDSGWGCMLRTGQMMLAQAFLIHLGESSRELIASMFCDTPSSPYSVQNVARVGQSKGKPIGSWFGPTTTALVLQDLVHKHCEESQDNTIKVYVGDHATLYLDQINKLYEQDQKDDTAQGDNGNKESSKKQMGVILLIPVMLGAGTYINPIYIPSLLQCFHLPGFLGIVGGRPNASLYFVGYIELAFSAGYRSKLVHLDPHVAVQPAFVAPEDQMCSLSEAQVRTLDTHSLDPSLLLGFYCRSRSEFEHLVAVTKAMADGTNHPLFCWQETNNNLFSTMDSDEDDYITV